MRNKKDVRFKEVNAIIVDTLLEKKHVGCKLVFIVKYISDGFLEGYKPNSWQRDIRRSMVWTIRKICLDVERNVVRILLSLAANFYQYLEQSDVKMFFCSNLKEET